MPRDTVASCVTEDSTPDAWRARGRGGELLDLGHHASLDAWPVRDGWCFPGWDDMSAHPGLVPSRIGWCDLSSV